MEVEQEVGPLGGASTDDEPTLDISGLAAISEYEHLDESGEDAPGEQLPCAAAAQAHAAETDEASVDTEIAQAPLDTFSQDSEEPWRRAARARQGLQAAAAGGPAPLSPPATAAAGGPPELPRIAEPTAESAPDGPRAAEGAHASPPALSATAEHAQAPATVSEAASKGVAENAAAAEASSHAEQKTDAGSAAVGGAVSAPTVLAAAEDGAEQASAACVKLPAAEGAASAASWPLAAPGASGLHVPRAMREVVHAVRDALVAKARVQVAAGSSAPSPAAAPASAAALASPATAAAAGGGSSVLQQQRQAQQPSEGEQQQHAGGEERRPDEAPERKHAEHQQQRQRVGEPGQQQGLPPKRRLKEAHDGEGQQRDGGEEAAAAAEPVRKKKRREPVGASEALAAGRAQQAGTSGTDAEDARPATPSPIRPSSVSPKRKPSPPLAPKQALPPPQRSAFQQQPRAPPPRPRSRPAPPPPQRQPVRAGSGGFSVSVEPLSDEEISRRATLRRAEQEDIEVAAGLAQSMHERGAAARVSGAAAGNAGLPRAPSSAAAQQQQPPQQQQPQQRPNQAARQAPDGGKPSQAPKKPSHHKVVPKMPGGSPVKVAGTEGGVRQAAAAQQAAVRRASSADKKKKGVVMHRGSVGLVRQLPSEAELEAAAAALARAAPGVEMKHKRGEEPYRAFGIAVNEAAIATPEAVKRVQDCQHCYWEMFKKARVDEAERARRSKGDTTVSQRPDMMARKAMDEAGLMVNQPKTAGHVPGHLHGARYFVRAEVACLGLHAPPVAGIYWATPTELPPGCPEFALSVVNSGQYATDADEGEHVTYTGQGGGNARSIPGEHKNQEMVAGNKALVGNIELGIPVRMLRKNPDPNNDFGNVYVNDGLYDVVGYRVSKNRDGKDVLLFDMVRRAGQPELLSKTLSFGSCSAPKTHTVEERGQEVKVVCKDISGGLEAIPIPAVNSVDDDNPFVLLDSSNAGATAAAAAIARRRERGDIGVCQPLLRYVVDSELGPGVPPPAPRVLPRQYEGRPHDHLALLNYGRLPYVERRSRGGATEMGLADNAAMVFECGPWARCPHGTACPQAITQQGLKWRLEVFKTRDKGWAVRSWDTIPIGAYVCSYVGRVVPLESVKDGDNDTFLYDLCKRADMTWANKQLPEDCEDPEHEVKYVVDAGEIGGVARFLNHSCDGKLWVQPVMARHGERLMPTICLFAAKNIPPWTELTYDYGQQYVMQNLGGRCHCGAAVCRGSAAAAQADGAGED